MYYCLGLKPFKDFWIDCNYNTLFSVLISREPSYKFAPFLNNYTYQIFKKETPNQTLVDCLKLVSLKDWFQKFGIRFQFSSQPINFRNDPHYIKYLQELVKEGTLVTVGTDLFYWIPNSVCWNKHHWDHYSLLHGFDDERKVFYVFDENMQGYNEHEIPEDRFHKAIQSSPVQPHGYTNQILDIEPFDFTLHDVVEYADELARDLGAMNVSNLWRLSEEDYAGRHMCDLFSMHIFQIADRQKANQYLFEILEAQGMIPHAERMESFIESSRELQNGWAYVKGKFIRTYVISDKEQSIQDINKKCNYLFDKEGAMWSRFRDCFG
jgi:hypothetical protein